MSQTIASQFDWQTIGRTPPHCISYTIGTLPSPPPARIHHEICGIGTRYIGRHRA